MELIEQLQKQYGLSLEEATEAAGKIFSQHAVARKAKFAEDRAAMASGDPRMDSARAALRASQPRHESLQGVPVAAHYGTDGVDRLAPAPSQPRMSYDERKAKMMAQREEYQRARRTAEPIRIDASEYDPSFTPSGRVYSDQTLTFASPVPGGRAVVLPRDENSSEDMVSFKSPVPGGRAAVIRRDGKAKK